MEKSGFEVICAIRSAIENEVDELIHHPCNNFEDLIYPMDKDELYENDGHLSVDDVKLASSTAVLLAYHKIERILLQIQLYND